MRIAVTIRNVAGVEDGACLWPGSCGFVVGVGVMGRAVGREAVFCWNLRTRVLGLGLSKGLGTPPWLSLAQVAEGRTY